MNQGKLDVVKQEITRLNIDILGISELKWTGMGEFNSDDHQVYYCRQESLRRNGVAFIVNKRVAKAVLEYNLQKDRMISVEIQGKPFNITIVQVYAPTTGAEEAEVDRFYEGVQHLLELTPKNDVLIIMGDWNAKVGIQKITGLTGKLKLKKVGKCTRPLRYDLNHIPDEYTVEVTNRFKELDLIDRVPEELWTEVCNIVQVVATKTITKKNKCKKAKWLSEDALQLAEERREGKGKGERERYTQLNAEFQRIARRDKNAFLNEQYKDIEENNRIGRTRDLFKKIGDMKGTFHAKMGIIKDQNGRDLTEAEDIKKRWQDYTELYKKELNVPDNHNEVVTDLEPDVLLCGVKWALGSLSNSKASGRDSIPTELFKILKDDAVKVLHLICQQIWKTQQWPQDWKSKVMLKILQAMLQQYVEQELSEVQAGFRRGRGTRNQIANIRWIMEKAREFQKNIYFCFIDYAKAFDCVDHYKLWQVLKEMGVPDHLICLLRNLYAGEEATVRTGHGTTDWFKIEKEVWQGCILLPCRFNLYAEHIMRKAGLDESPVGIKIAGRNINSLRYADDTTLMAESEEELKNLLMLVKEESAKVGLKLNIKETKIMASGPLTFWQIDGEEMEVAKVFEKEGLPGEEPNAGNNRWQKKKGAAEDEVARLNPLSMGPQKALETIGANLQKQYENWQPRHSDEYVSHALLVNGTPELLFCQTNHLIDTCANTVSNLFCLQS
ncbi:Craniofacial development protein 2 [Varanus komodoensis]|nr:Craniofacial development protein 2 [Varanus komodoensis]